VILNQVIYLKANIEVIYSKHLGINGAAFPKGPFDPVRGLTDVAVGRTDEKGATENQQQLHPELLSAWLEAIYCARELDTALTSLQTPRLLCLPLP